MGSFAGALTIVFVALKLLGYIVWSWWWVFSPLIFSFIISLVFFSLFALLTHKSRRFG